MKTKPKVGDIFYSLNVGNAARNKKQKLTPVRVVKVGRKYFYCCTNDVENPYEHQLTGYYVDGWKEKTNYTANSRLYASIKDFEDEKEEAEISKFIYKNFNWGRNKSKISLKTLRAIKKILDEEIALTQA